jgi:uncharacterized membrane protein required for colicin V production
VSDLPLIDMIAGSVLALAMVRGLWIGLVREGLSLAAIALCTIVVRLFVDPVSRQVTELTANEISGRAAVWIGGLLLVMATVLICGVAARLLRRGVQFAGLGWADRLGGGALGLAEGSILAAICVVIALWLVGPDHPTTKDARSVALIESLRVEAGLEGELPVVSSPGEWLMPSGPGSEHDH